MVRTVQIDDPQDLDPAAILQIATRDAAPALSEALLGRLDARHQTMRAALATSGPVYGVTTGMGALSGVALDDEARSRHQQALLVARSVGGPPWLEPVEVRAVLAARLRSFLDGDAAVSAALIRRLATMIAHDVLPAIPRTPSGVAGEIIELAHLGNALVGDGRVLDDARHDHGGRTRPAREAWASVGDGHYRLAPKEGVALIEGIPVATGLSVLAANDLDRLIRQASVVLAAEFAVTGAGRDVLDPAITRADPVLASVASGLLALAGPATAGSLQPPVSFRAGPQVLAQLSRSTAWLHESINRALDGVTDSPAFVDDRFVGTAGFFGYDLAAQLHTATVAVLGVAEIGASRLHRMMDPAVTGLTAQLSADPGPQTGISPVHKRAAGVTHRMRAFAMPSTVGPVETSAGQEDVQAFTLEAVASCRHAVAAAAEVLACELLAVHQARCLGADVTSPTLRPMLDRLSAVLPSDPSDRPFGLDIEAIRRLLDAGWPDGGG